MFRLFAPTIEEYAIAVEKDGHIDALENFHGRGYTDIQGYG